MVFPRHAYLKQTLLTRTACPAAVSRFARPYAWTCRSLYSSRRSRKGTSTALRTREYSVVAPPAQASEDVTVACRSNGEILLNIFHPHANDEEAPLILFLPTGVETIGVEDAKIIAALSAASNGTVVRVNYRAGKNAQYPTPVHDVLTGFDYVKQRFAAESWTTRSGRTKRTHLRMGVCGQLVGGSLASALALTESHLAQDRISAAAVNSPISDWVFPESQLSIADAMIVTGGSMKDTALNPTLRKKPRSKARLPSWEAYSDTSNAVNNETLLSSRDLLFRKPASYFDPFASPIHFFRSSGSLVPSDPTIISDGDDPLSALQPSKPRKAHRAFPPSNTTLTLPHFRLSTGSQNPLYDSNEEFVKVLRRSAMRTALTRASTQAMLDRFEEDSSGDEDRTDRAIEAAERKVEYHLAEGSGLWGTTDEAWMDEVWKVGRWFRKILG